MLKEAQKDPPTWLFVAGHYPVFSRGDHGDTSEIKTYLLPLLIEYNVHAYFAGHDHISEHLQYKGIEFFVVGAGCMTDSLKSNSDASLVWAGTGYSAFAAVQAFRDCLTITFIDSASQKRYSYTLQNPNPSSLLDSVLDKIPSEAEVENSGEAETDDPLSTAMEVAMTIEDHAFSIVLFVYVLLGFVAVGIPVIYQKATNRSTQNDAEFHANIAFTPVDLESNKVESINNLTNIQPVNVSGNYTTTTIKSTLKQPVTFVKSKANEFHKKWFPYSQLNNSEETANSDIEPVVVNEDDSVRQLESNDVTVKLVESTLTHSYKLVDNESPSGMPFSSARSAISSLYSNSESTNSVNWEPVFGNEKDLDDFFRLADILSDCSSEISSTEKPSNQVYASDLPSMIEDKCDVEADMSDNSLFEVD